MTNRALAEKNQFKTVGVSRVHAKVDTYVHADGLRKWIVCTRGRDHNYTRTRFSVENSGKQRHAARVEFSSRGRRPKQAGCAAMIAATRVSLIFAFLYAAFLFSSLPTLALVLLRGLLCWFCDIFGLNDIHVYIYVYTLTACGVRGIENRDTSYQTLVTKCRM